MSYIVIILLIIAIVFILIKNKRQQSTTNIDIEPQAQDESYEEIKIEELNEEKIPYIRKNLMTKNEWVFYKNLKPIAEEMNLSILCKTRIADLIEIEKGLSKSEWQTAFNKINKKHIDFILCNPENLFPLLLIELDDSTHDTDKGKERDTFVEKVFEKTGYKLLRIRGTADLKEKIQEKMNNEH